MLQSHILFFFLYFSSLDCNIITQKQQITHPQKAQKTKILGLSFDSGKDIIKIFLLEVRPATKKKIKEENFQIFEPKMKEIL
jgi:hypothetical protein